jgi:hypothetical protein
MIDLIKNTAIEQFNSIFKQNQGYNRTFKLLIPVGTDQLLILGIMNTRFKYDTCVAILNPSNELTRTLVPGHAYTGNSLPKLVNGKCDLMVDLLVKTFPKGWEVKVMRGYRARKA